MARKIYLWFIENSNNICFLLVNTMVYLMMKFIELGIILDFFSAKIYKR